MALVMDGKWCYCFPSIYLKMRPARWPGGAFDFPVKTSVSGRKQKDSLIQGSFADHCTRRFHVVFLLLSFYIVILWNMPLFKMWSEDKLNKKFVVAESFAELVSKGKRFCLYSFS